MVYLKYKNYALTKKSQTVQQDNLGFFIFYGQLLKLDPPQYFGLISNFRYQIQKYPLKSEI